MWLQSSSSTCIRSMGYVIFDLRSKADTVDSSNTAVTRQLLSVWLPASLRFLSTDRKQFLTITTASLSRSFTLPSYKINTADMKKTLIQCVAFCLSVCFQRYSMIQFPYGKHYIQRFKIIKSQQYTTPGFRLRIQEVRSARWIANTWEWAFW